jgi:hypothetical protein
MSIIRTVSIIALLVVVNMSLCGCSPAKTNVRVTREYNDAIELYNRMAIAFTNLARFVEDNASAEKGLDRAFWEDYDSRKKKVAERMGLMEQYEFENPEMLSVRASIQTLMDSLNEYMQMADGYRRDESRDRAKEFISRHRALYDDILDQTSEIVMMFDEVYDKIFY